MDALGHNIAASGQFVSCSSEDLIGIVIKKNIPEINAVHNYCFHSFEYNPVKHGNAM
jgi:hypothetical protein